MINKHDNRYYNKNLQPYANRLRKEMTKAEACLCLPAGSSSVPKFFESLIHKHLLRDKAVGILAKPF